MSLTYLITGASSGIGECFAQELAKMGHNLVLVARRLDRLEKLAEELQNQFQIKCYCFSCDLSKRDETLALVEKIKSQNIEIDGLINNAGFSVAREFHNTELSAQMDFVETCVTAPTILCHAFLPQMRAKKFGRIINVSSMVAFSNGAAGHSL
ncbi:MAG: SDR family NAD(P)-dependent oxidoreductase, partial [Caulobacterales bacterium]|nr:SDR family NAD(P)-dependent oxidoreductase [Caulobacterales bacterium]